MSGVVKSLSSTSHFIVRAVRLFNLKVKLEHKDHRGPVSSLCDVIIHKNNKQLMNSLLTRKLSYSN